MTQRVLSNRQIEAFYHDGFVDDQANDFIALVGAPPGVVADVGGGCGFFAERLMNVGRCRVRVMDTDPESVRACEQRGIEAVLGDALQPIVKGDEAVVSFNLILHHLVGSSERITRDLQCRALVAWRDSVTCVFVNEYIYESYLSGVSGWLIFRITKSPILSALGRVASALIPAFRANTFGVGVRFRSHSEWTQLFSSIGYDVKRTTIGRDEPVALPLRLLLIKTIRRDSFILEPRTGPVVTR